MSTNIYISNLHRYLIRYSDLVSESNSLSFGNEATIAENLFCDFLNTAFGWHLVNINIEKKNADTIDLIDIKRKIAIQVTSDKKFKQKYERTVSSYKSSKTKEAVKHLFVLFIREGCPSPLLKIKRIDGIEVEGLNREKILNRLKFANPSAIKLRKLNILFEDALSPVLLREALIESTTKSTGVPKQKLKDRNPGIFIQRAQLTEKLYNFAQTGNGLLIGGPGAGKSVLMEELQRLCESKNTQCFIIRINDLITGDDAEIARELQIDKDWITVLKNVKIPCGQKAKRILVFDAFDTAKDETVKSRVLSRIKIAMRDLSNHWSILVSARTYDAEKSTRLLDLFPTINLKGQALVRSINVPDLTEQEIINAIKRNTKLKKAYEQSSQRLIELLRIPYFLKLLEELIGGESQLSATELAAIETEEQLLEKYWSKKVVLDNRYDFFLGKFTHLLSSEETLSCAKSSILNNDNIMLYTDLLSQGVIAETSVSKQNIAFSHNIHLEFAIHKYMLPENPAVMLNYLYANPTMPFFFRQSFVYFYGKLWRLDRKHFWKHYLLMFEQKTALTRLFHQTIMNYVLAANFQTTADLERLFSFKDQEEEGQAIRKMLEGVRFVTKEVIRSKDIPLYLKASENLSIPILWELGVLINKTSTYSRKHLTAKDLKTLFIAADNYLIYVLTIRKKQIDPWLVDNNGTGWGVQNIAELFDIKKKRGLVLMNLILNLLHEPEFPIPIFSRLADELVSIANRDPKLAAHIYRVIYLRNENSQKVTNYGSRVVLNLTSNRSQDFNGVHYRMENLFGKLLQIAPQIFIPLGIEIVNHYSVEVKTYHKAFTTKIFQLFSFKVKFTPEPFLYESDDDKNHGPSSHLNRIIGQCKNDLEACNVSRAKEQLLFCFRKANAGVVWRQLIQLVATFPKQLKSMAEELLNNLHVFAVYETVYDMGELIKAVFPHLSQAKAKKFEQKILNLPKEGDHFKDEEQIKQIVLRLLSRIDGKNLQIPFSIELLVKEGKKENPKEIKTIGAICEYPNKENNLRRLGIEKTDGLAMERYEMLDKLEAFNSSFNNKSDVPAKESYRNLWPLAERIFEVNRNDRHINDGLQFNSDNTLSQFCFLVSRRRSKLTKKEKALLREIAGFYLSHSEYVAKEYDQGDIMGRFEAFAPNPRVWAVNCLTHLATIENTGEIDNLLLPLIHDNSQPVRSRMMRFFTHYWSKNRPAFWDGINQRAIKELDGFCIQGLIINIRYDNIIKEDKEEVEKIAWSLLIKLFAVRDAAANEVWQYYTSLLLKLILFHESVAGGEIIRTGFKMAEFSTSLANHIIDLVDPHKKENDFLSEPDRYHKLFELQYELVLFRLKSLQENGLKADSTQQDMEVIDSIFQQLYYTVVHGKKEGKGKEVSDQRMNAFFDRIKNLLTMFVEESKKIEGGFVAAHTGYHIVQLLNRMISYDAGFALRLASQVVNFSSTNGFTYDSTTLKEVLSFTEKILIDHKELLSDQEHFNHLIVMLDLFANSGWQEALEFTWRIKDFF